MNLLRKYCAINYWNGLKYKYKSFSYFQLFLIPSPGVDTPGFSLCDIVVKLFLVLFELSHNFFRKVCYILHNQIKCFIGRLDCFLLAVIFLYCPEFKTVGNCFPSRLCTLRNSRAKSCNTFKYH